jgi:acyl carrier protein
MVRPETHLLRVPFCWSGVTVYAPGQDALLVRMSQEGADVITMMLTDLTGAPVASVERLVLRPVRVPSANAGTRPRDDQPATARTVPATLAAELAELPEAGQRRRLLTLVLTGTAGALGYDSPDPIRADQGFLDAGLDSLGAVELREVLTDATGLSLPETVAFDHSTPQALAEYLWLALCRDDADQSAPPMTDPRPVDLSTATNEEIFDFIDNDLGVS